jgi:hypothetical protein
MGLGRSGGMSADAHGTPRRSTHVQPQHCKRSIIQQRSTTAIVCFSLILDITAYIDIFFRPIL